MINEMKKLFILAVSIMATVAMSAQVSDLKMKTSNYVYVIPAEFTSDGKDYVECIDDEFDAEYYYKDYGFDGAEIPKSVTFNIYNDDFEKVKSVNIPVDVTTTTYTSYEHEEIPTHSSSTEEHLATFTSLDEAITYISSSLDEEVNKTEVKGDTTYIYLSYEGCYYKYEKYGELYPEDYFIYVQDGHLYLVENRYESVTTENWVVDYEGESHKPHGAEVINDLSIYDNATLTQTLFNTDANYEYIKLTYEPYTYTDSTMATDYDDNGQSYSYCISKTVYNTHYVKGFNVVSETGTVLATATFDATEDELKHNYYIDFALVVLNGKTYLCADGFGYQYYYRIDPTSSSIKQVGRAKKAHVSPTVANRYEDITVELEEDGTSAHKVSVVDAAGRTVYNANVPAGQRSVKINASRLSNGMNIISVKNGNSKPNNCKVYVK